MTYDEAVTSAAITIYSDLRNTINRPPLQTIAKWSVEEAKVLIDELVESGINYDPSSQSITMEDVK